MTASHDDLVLVTVQDGVASVVLNRPARQNGWTRALGEQYFAALLALARDGDARAIVVSGAGGSFCVGADAEVLTDHAVEPAQGPRPPLDPYWLPLTIGKPLIAAIAGPCFGVGLQQALCCDLRFAADDAKLSTAYARRGLVAEMGVSWLLPRVVGLGHAADLLLSGRLVRAAEAERMGLVNRVVPAADLLDEAMAYARNLAEKCAPTSMRVIKSQLYRDLSDGLAAAYGRSESLLEEAFAGPDFREGVLSWREQRPPSFPGLAPELALLDISAPTPDRR